MESLPTGCGEGGAVSTVAIPWRDLSGPFHKCVNVFLDPVSGWLGIVAQMGGLA